MPLTNKNSKMPKVCGIEIKGNSAIVVVIDGVQDNFSIIETSFKKTTLYDTNSQEDVRSFYTTIMNFFKANNFDRIGVKARATKGSFAGGSTSFKIEGLIQNSDYPVELIHVNTVKARLKNTDLDFTGVNNYQVEAMKVAYCLIIE